METVEIRIRTEITQLIWLAREQKRKSKALKMKYRTSV